MPLEDLIQKIVSVTGIGKEEVERKIKEKQHEMSDLVSAEGAAYIVAKEMGLNLVERKRERKKIKELKAGERNIILTARISEISPVREFEKNGTRFKVSNISLLDETGNINLSLWNEQTDNLEILKTGMAVEIFGGYIKEGWADLRISRRGGVKLLEEDNIIKGLDEIKNNMNGLNLENVSAGDSCNIRACLIQLFETETFYEVCPACNARIRPENGVFKCKTHGEVKPALGFVISGVVDDGFGNMRAVFFNEIGAKLLGFTTKQILEKRGVLFENIDLLGKEFVFSGKIRENKMFNRKEFIVSEIENVDIRKETEKLIGGI